MPVIVKEDGVVDLDQIKEKELHQSVCILR
jgi:hypothetical protein